MKNEWALRIVTSLVAGFFFFSIYFLSGWLFSLLLLVILASILVFEWPALVEKKGWFGSSFSVPLAAFTLVYPVLPVFALLFLQYRYEQFHWFLPLYPFIIAWIFDTVAYAVGSMIGFHKICPSISPGKSWEGFLAGLGAVFILHKILFVHERLGEIVLLSLFIGTLAFLGDVFESYLKRRVSLKDAGGLLPGHGGLLDRFDSVFFVALGVLLLDLTLRGGFISLF